MEFSDVRLKDVIVLAAFHYIYDATRLKLKKVRGERVVHHGHGMTCVARPKGDRLASVSDNKLHAHENVT